MSLKDVLGLNARNHLYAARYNPRSAKWLANSKLLTKSALRKAKLPVPRLYRVFRKEAEVDKFDFLFQDTQIPCSFFAENSSRNWSKFLHEFEKVVVAGNDRKILPKKCVHGPDFIFCW